MIILAQETTTLAEGATVSIVRGQTQTGSVGTYLVAARERNQLRMRVDDVSPGSMRTYLDLMVRCVLMERSKLKAAPQTALRSPDSIKDFVHNMAQAGMFVFETLNHADVTGNNGVPTISGKISKQHKRKNNKQNLG